MLNHQLSAMSQSATVALADAIRAVKAEGRDVVELQTGDPGFQTPKPVIEACERAIKDGLTHYDNSRGLPELRTAIAAALHDASGVDYDPGCEILVTCGGVHAYYCALQAILNPDDEVLVPDPSWMPHTNIVEMLGGRAVRVPSTSDLGFLPSMDAWENACHSRAVALVLNLPNNPTGAVADAGYLGRLLEFAEHRGLYVLSDEVYHALVFDGDQHVSPASVPFGKRRTLVINSFSKTYAMTGWRIGYLAGPAPVIEQALKASQHTITNVAPFVQKAALRALTHGGVAVEVERMRAEYEERRDLVLSELGSPQSTCVRVAPPRGGFYLFIDVRAIAADERVLVRRLLDEAGVAVVPGSVYGECGRGFIRLSLAGPSDALVEGARRIRRWLDSSRSSRD